MNLRTRALSTVLALAAASAAPAGVWGFEEDDFQASDWTSSAFTQYGDALVNVLHQPNGDPENNGYLSLEFVNDPGVEAFAVSLYGGAVYDPSVQGAVSSITLGVNTRHDFANDPDLYNTIFALEQDGMLYLNSEWDAAPGGSAWLAVSDTYTADDFTAFNPSTDEYLQGARPDFSVSGGAIRFGLASDFNNWFVFEYWGVYSFDEFTVRVTPVPTPGAAALFGLAGLAAARRRR